MRKTLGVTLCLALTALLACSQAPPAKQDSAVPSTAAPTPTATPAKASEPVPRKGGELRVAFPGTEAGDMRALDPYGPGGTYVHTVLGTIFDMLAVQDPKTNAMIGGLAESWDITPDGLLYTFRLKKGVKSHDGTPFNTAAVKYNFDRAFDPRLAPDNSRYPAYLGDLERFEPVDDLTFKLHFKKPSAILMQSLFGRTFFGMVSPTAAEKLGKTFRDTPVGTGPFRFVSWKRGDRLIVERNPDYNWAPGFLRQGPPLVDRIIFTFIPEGATRVAALESGEVNYIENVPDPEVARLKADTRFEVLLTPKNGTAGYFDFNMGEFPTSELAVRRAIALAIDRNALMRTVYYGAHQPAFTILPEQMLAHNPSARWPDYDVQKSRQILDEAGWKDRGDGIRARDGKPLELIGVTYGEYALLEAMQAQLQAIGVKLNVRKMTNAAWKDLTEKRTGPYHVAYGNPQGWTNEDPNIMARSWGTEGGVNVDGNYGWFVNKEFDDAVIQGRLFTDPEKRKPSYFRAQQLLLDHMATVPVVNVNISTAVRKGVHGVFPDARGTYRYMHNIWLEEGVK